MEQDLIALLYVSDGASRENLLMFSKSNGFALNTCTDVSAAASRAIECPPDLILIEKGSLDLLQIETLLGELNGLDCKFKPDLFLILSENNAEKSLRAVFKSGVSEFIVPPVEPDGIKDKYRVYQRVRQLEQKVFARELKLKKTFEYLDQFKKELKKTKNTLLDERVTLNNSLKQVNRMTLERTRLKKEISEIRTRLVENTEGFCDILSDLIENRVETNRGHGERVSHIAYFIAKQLKFNEKKLEDLRKAAMLHEVGLLLVPESVLHTPPAQLSGYEKDQLMKYPVRGADFFLNCSEFKACAEIIRNMGENSDGTGRPNGLKRRYIPLLSRILAGADVFDTLKDREDITNLETFLEQLEGFAGTRLDPNIVAWLEKYAVLHMGADDYRVKGVSIHRLKPGMTLGTALFTRTGTKLFSVNTLLTQDAIDKIKNYDREYPVDETVYIRA